MLGEQEGPVKERIPSCVGRIYLMAGEDLAVGPGATGRSVLSGGNSLREAWLERGTGFRRTPAATVPGCYPTR